MQKSSIKTMMETSTVMGGKTMPTVSHAPNGTVHGLDYYAVKYWNDNIDSRSGEHWLMVGGPWKLATITIAYCLMIIIGTWLMKRREPFELRNTMLAYNVLLVAINAFFLYESLVWTCFGARLFDFNFPSEHDRSESMMRMSNMYQIYLWTKFVDYFDTFFFVLRKKNNQLTFLHIYHHISVPIIGWTAAWTCPTMPLLGLFALLNCFCHVIMYSYYALASFGPKVAPYLWWKRYITQVQLIQFILITVYGSLMLLFNKGYPLIWCSLPIIQGVIFFAMFGNFYIQAYRKARQQRELRKQQTDTSAIVARDDANSVTKDKAE